MTNITSPGMKAKVIGTAAAVAMLLSPNARADLINGIVDQWSVGVATTFVPGSIRDSNGVSPGGVAISNGNQSLRWGTDLGSGQSGLDIGNSPVSGTVLTNGPAVQNVSITHLNRPITGTSLSYVDIMSSLTLTPLLPPGAALPSTALTFGVHYLETPNASNPCADGGTNGVGVNVNGCADIYVTDANSLNFPFYYDLDGAGPLPNRLYYISFFEATNGLNPLSPQACAVVIGPQPCLGFETPEGQDTTVRFASLITTQPVHVPEPGTGGLAGLGLAAVGLLRRRLNLA